MTGQIRSRLMNTVLILRETNVSDYAWGKVCPQPRYWLEGMSSRWTKCNQRRWDTVTIRTINCIDVSNGTNMMQIRNTVLIFRETIVSEYACLVYN